jgi:uncharacterized membrane protein/mono/diheme cytochrome c family protein
MKPQYFTAIILCVLLLPPNLSAGDTGLVSAVRQIFEAKCAECHAPDSGKRKAIAKWSDWRNLEELKRRYVAEDFSLEASTLWDSIIEENPKARMPPENAKGGALTEAEKETIKRWITSGAPLVEAPVNGGTRSVASNFEPERSRQGAPLQSETTPQPSPSGWTTLQSWLGKFHPVVVHFPIALLLLAAFGEIANMIRAGIWQPRAARFCLWIAAASAVVAMMLGFFAEESGAFNETVGGIKIVEIHEWLGIVTTILAVAAAVLCEWYVRRETPRHKWLFRIALFLAAVLVGVTGHFGGLLTFGVDHFGW